MGVHAPSQYEASIVAFDACSLQAISPFISPTSGSYLARAYLLLILYWVPGIIRVEEFHLLEDV